VIEGKGVVEK